MSVGYSDVPGMDGMRNSIIEASRELFAKFGYKKTTMEDIALALRKGKSSLYYYFKNKEEIFQAVIELEEEMLFGKLKDVVTDDLAPKEKLRQYVMVRMETISQLQNYMKALRDDLQGGYDFLDRIKGKSEEEETRMLAAILEEGTKEQAFQVKNVNLAATAIAIALKGLEVPLFRSLNNMDDFKVQMDNILNILFYGVIKR